jgi:hypothetical protein
MNDRSNKRPFAEEWQWRRQCMVSPFHFGQLRTCSILVRLVLTGQNENIVQKFTIGQNLQFSEYEVLTFTFTGSVFVIHSHFHMSFTLTSFTAFSFTAQPCI